MNTLKNSEEETRNIHISPVETKVANPEFSSEIHLTHRVKNCLTVLPSTHDRVILYGGQVRALLERCVKGGQWDDHPRGLQP